MSVFYWVLFIGFPLYISWSLYFFWRNPDKYVENLQLMRKAYYVLFVIAVASGVLFKVIKLNDWQFLLELGGLFIFVDIAVFQTPDILKIWNTEFQHSHYIRQTIRKNEEILGYNSSKVTNFTKVISNTNQYFTEIETPADWDAYQSEMKQYMKQYTDTFQFYVSIFPFEISEDEEVLQRNLASAYEQVQLRYNFNVKDDEWKNSLIDALFRGESVQLSQKTEPSNISSEERMKKAFIIAYYGVKYNMLIGINSSNNVEVDGIDASHILNMANIFDWHMA